MFRFTTSQLTSLNWHVTKALKKYMQSIFFHTNGKRFCILSNTAWPRAQGQRRNLKVADMLIYVRHLPRAQQGWPDGEKSNRYGHPHLPAGQKQNMKHDCHVITKMSHST